MRQARERVATMVSLLPFGAIFLAVAVFLCFPKLARNSIFLPANPDPPARVENKAASPGVAWGAYEGQVENFRQQMRTVLSGTVALVPTQGMPIVANVTLDYAISPKDARRRAGFAWLFLAQMRRNYLSRAQANACVVHIYDRDGNLLATADSQSGSH